jgi:catechol 2,3-dioxygenase-like lactoylglutathione lyase family enzyme
MAQGSIMLEFRVDDVDAEYARLRSIQRPDLEFVMAPTTLPWGNRSIYFRDPDGNLINFFTPVSS